MLNNHELQLLTNKLSEKILSEENKSNIKRILDRSCFGIYSFNDCLEYLYIHSDANTDNLANEIWIILKTDPIFIEYSDNIQISDFLHNVIDWNSIVKAAEIRLDFKDALEEVEFGPCLSEALHYALSDEDIHNLAIIHRDNPELRQKIEDLLDDCSFEAEADAFAAGYYDNYIPEEELTK